MKILNQINVN